MPRPFEIDLYSAQISTGIVLIDGPVLSMEPHDTLAPEDSIVTRDLLDEIKSLEPDTFTLLPGAVDKEILEVAVQGIFNEIPDLSLTRNESVHEVRFGQLIVRSYFGDERTELSSLKPFEAAGDAAHEFSLARYFTGAGKSHGFRTFEPQGVARLSTGEYAVLTKYEHSVRSLDNIFWNPDVDLTGQLAVRALQETARLLGSLHAAGWTHGDAQIKNMFVSNYDEMFIADLESMKPFKHKNGRLVEQQVSYSIDDDLRKLGSSITDKRSNGEELSLEQYEMFSLIYTGIVISPRSAVPKDIRKNRADTKDLLR